MYEGRSSLVSGQRGVLLLNLGMPGRSDASFARKFLLEFLGDPLVMGSSPKRGRFQRVLSKWMLRLRAARLADSYRTGRKDSGSQPNATAEQATALRAVLPEHWWVFAAARYGEPSIAAVLKQMQDQGIERIVAVSLYPQFAQATTGTIMRELYRVVGETARNMSLATRAAWHDDSGYVSAQARLIAEWAHSHDVWPDDAHLLFTAYGPPDSDVQLENTYAPQMRRTVDLVAQRLGWPGDRVSLAFQGRFGIEPGPGCRPVAGQKLEQLTGAGVKRVLVCHLSFAEQGVDALEQIDVESQELFAASGGRLYDCPTLYTQRPFISALRSLVIGGPRPVSGRRPKPLLAPKRDAGPTDDDPKALVMIGTSLAKRLRSGRGPHLKHNHPGVFAKVRKSRKTLLGFLDWVRDEGLVKEAFVWNTCQRLEFYGWLRDPADSVEREWVVARVRNQLFGIEPEDLKVNVLFGVDAWYHLVRTASGLNSALPGDADVVAQLQTSCQIAERARVAGPIAARLVGRAVDLTHQIRAETAWGQFSHGYCLAALSHVRTVSGVELDECRHLVIGGSATSRSVLSTLSQKFAVPQHRMTLAYRDHHGQMKLLRAALGHGKRRRVHSYSEESVLRAIADADYVFFGIDHPQPVLDAEVIGGLRDFTKRPLTIVDFNSYGSMSYSSIPDGVKVWTEAELDRAVAAYADLMCSRPEFSAAVEAVETWIEERLPVSDVDAGAKTEISAANSTT
jgi:ferrochelatase